MARKTARPGRTLGVFFLVLAIVYALVALGGSWKPELGLDLQGGTRIQMIAKGHPNTAAMNDARDIITNRVNGSGITSATVETQGGNVIVVEIPGQNRSDLVNEVSQTAQLRFRLVACESTCSSSTTTNPSSAPSSSSSPSGIAPLAPSSTTSSSGKNRAPLGFDLKKGAASSAASPSATSSPSMTSSTPPPTPADPSSAGTSPTSSSGDTTPDVPGDASLSSALGFINNPPTAWQTKFGDFTCPTTGEAKVNDAPGQPLITCDAQHNKYLLSPAIIEGTQVSGANYGIPQNQLNYVVTLSFHSAGNRVFADATGAISQTNQLFAIVLDGQVISAATAEGRINGGAQISGGFNATTAKALATNLKFGALPVSFNRQTGILVSTVGPSLAGNQLSAGLWAGAIGLLLVMLYCLLYYRGLGVVVIGSLIVAGITIYGLVLLLSKTASFTLDLPGIAGLIVAVGITADSFIVYFERIRDEMRDGKSMRVAVNDGWVRARRTTLAADGVSLLAAVVLYVFAGGDVRGFAFALGLSTIVDLIIFFFFTHPLVQYLATHRFFNRGHRFSGLDASALGIEAVRGDNALRGGRA